MSRAFVRVPEEGEHTVKNEIKLYNVLFPLWMLLLFPATWFVVLPGNFIIDSVVLLLAMAGLRVEDKKRCYGKSIWKIYGFGLLADGVGSAYMLLMTAVFQVGQMGDEWYLTLPALLISAVLIFLLNYYVTFRHRDGKLRRTMALVFALFTAPYTFLVPSSWLY